MLDIHATPGSQNGCDEVHPKHYTKSDWHLCRYNHSGQSGKVNLLNGVMVRNIHTPKLTTWRYIDVTGHRKCSTSATLHSNFHRVHLATTVSPISEILQVRHLYIVRRYKDVIPMLGIVNEPTGMPMEPLYHLYVVSRPSRKVQRPQHFNIQLLRSSSHDSRHHWSWSRERSLYQHSGW